MLNYTFVNTKFLLEGAMGVSNKFVLGSNSEFTYDSFDKQYERTFKKYYVGPAASVSSGIRLPNYKALTLTVTGEYLIDPRAVNQFLRLKISQLTFRVGYTL